MEGLDMRFVEIIRVLDAALLLDERHLRNGRAGLGQATRSKSRPGRCTSCWWCPLDLERGVDQTASPSKPIEM
jgi:hypothetical protein